MLGLVLWILLIGYSKLMLTQMNCFSSSQLVSNVCLNGNENIPKIIREFRLCLLHNAQAGNLAFFCIAFLENCRKS